MSKPPVLAYLLRVIFTRLPARFFRTAVIAGRDSVAPMRASWTLAWESDASRPLTVASLLAKSPRLSSKANASTRLVWSSK
jgi:hypothetical protein